MEKETDMELRDECVIGSGSTADVVPNSEKEEESIGTIDDACKLRNLFDHVLKVFLDVCCNDNPRPLPVMVEDGRQLDLFKLFWSVRKLGGYDMVSKNSLWDFVADECGLSGRKKGLVKLVHVKYLREFDKSLQGDSSKKDLVNKELNSLLKELELDLQRFMTIEEDPTKKEMATEELKAEEEEQQEDGSRDEKVNLLNENNIEKGDKFSEMLDWLSMIAINSDDPSVGMIPPPSKWKDCRNEEPWSLALYAKESIRIKRETRTSLQQSLFQKKLKIHPSMYDEVTGHSDRIKDKLKCNESIPSLKKCRFYPDCISCTAPQDKVSLKKVKNSKAVTSRKRKVKDEKDSVSSNEKFRNRVRRNEIMVGPLFQAEVPEWTGTISESDSKWLGITVSVPQNEDDSLMSMVSIDKGRSDSCGCQHPGSVQCTRFHIAEKRLTLKLELGSLFYEWKFDRMGEDISLSWTIKQEKKFKALIGLRNSSDRKALWMNTSKFFPNKTRENLVSYFFNVFILRSRRFQNRMTPQDIDSSDDENEYSDIDDQYGLSSLEFPRPNLSICM